MIPKLEIYKERWQVESDRSIKPGLESMHKALQMLNNPHESLNYVHLAGTNGKGSTVTFIDEIARAHGLKVGKFTSPAIIDLHDQLQINGENISEQQLNAIFETFKKSGLSGVLTDFELLTCAAFLHFATEQVDLVVLEAGMGGRFDSTNVITPLVSVIPSIALEHTNFLGTTLEQIAHHKAGIIKYKKDVVIGELPDEAKAIVIKEALEQQAEVHAYNEQFFIEQFDNEEWYTNKVTERVGPLKRKMLGQHQASNMALAITAFQIVANELKINLQNDAVVKGVRQAVIPGRFEEVLSNVYFDGAHNPASVMALQQTLQQFPTKKIHVVLGMLADKDVTQVLSILEPLAETMSFIDIPNDRAMPANQLFELSQHENKQIIVDALPFLKQPLADDEMIVVTGSLYLLAHIRAQLIDGEK